MKLSMLADFKILKDFGDGEYVAMDSSNAKFVSIGGFRFAIGDKVVPFDWEQHYGEEEDNLFSYVTGAGFGHGTYELDDDCFERDYAKLGIKREDISAEFLSSVHHIEDFYVNFEDSGDDVSIGYFSDNAKPGAEYKLELVEISFEDIATGKYYDVKKEVLEAFNKGERGLIISEKEMVEMAAQGERRLQSYAKEAIADLDSKISECEAIANALKDKSDGCIDRDAR